MIASKINDTGTSCSTSSDNGSYSPPLKRARERSFRIVAILSNEICTEQLPLEEYFVLCIRNPCAIGSILKLLPAMPDSADHLKRIKDGRILIQPSSIHMSENLLISIRNLLQEEPVIETVQVPAKKPFTRRQFEWAKQRWSTGFHPNKEIEALLNGTYFNDLSKSRIIEFYLRAEKIGNGDAGCVIVDMLGNIVAESGIRPKPLGHAVMSAVADLCESHRTQQSDVLQYLGTGFDVYLTHEPCSMCAMALVHFRVGRLFFGKRTPKGGAVESSWRIQEEKRINHHYRVFRIDEIE